MVNQFDFAETTSSKELYYLKVVYLKPLLAGDTAHLRFRGKHFAFSLPGYGANSGLRLVGATLA